MKDSKIIEIAAIGFIGLVIAPVVIGGVINVVGMTVTGISNINNKIKFNQKIKNGLKDGSIVEVDGKYYEVSVDEA